MKVRLPKGCAGVSHAGKPLALGPDRTIDVAPDVALALAPHGLVPVSEATPLASGRVDAEAVHPKPIDPKRIDRLSRADLVEALVVRGLPVPAGVPALRASLRQALAKS